MDGSEKIQKAAQPRCFKGIKSFPVDYLSNSKAWMTSAIWNGWIKDFDRKMRLSGRKVLLVIDNCPAHPTVSGLSNVEVVYLPPSTTSKTQPCDQGIIQALKRRYRFHLLTRFLECIEKKDFKPNVLDAMVLIRKAWEEVSPETIRNCFKHCGFATHSEDGRSTHEGNACSSTSFPDEAEICTRLSEHLQDDSPIEAVIEEFVNCDWCTPTHAELDCSEIASLVSGKTASSEQDSVDTCDVELCKPSRTEIKHSLAVLKNYLLFVDGGTQLKNFFELEKFVEHSLIAQQQQKKITDYMCA